MGCKSSGDLHKLAAKYAEDMVTNPTDIWIKVTSSATGKIVAASNWKLYLGSAPVEPRGLDEVMPWLDGEIALEAKRILEPMNEARILSNTAPFLRKRN